MNLHSYLLKNGDWCEATELPMSDRGFRLGMALFETIRIHNSKAHLIQDHLLILRQSAAELGFPAFASENLQSALGKLTLPHQGVLRLFITAGPGSISDPIEAPQIIAYVEERETRTSTSLKLVSSAEPLADPFPSTKSVAYWHRAQTLAKAKALGADNVLVFNQAAALVGAATANVFLVLDGQLCTPRVEDGARPGVVRAWVMERRPVKVHTLRKQELARASEIFLCNSLIGIAPVGRLESTQFHRFHQAEALQADWEDALKESG
ncbi:MAG: aminotransferase class IV [Verrucomicrobiales bacterium]